MRCASSRRCIVSAPSLGFLALAFWLGFGFAVVLFLTAVVMLSRGDDGE